MSRVLDIASFLERAGWDSADQIALDADFSPRRFARLTHQDGRQAILMDADTDQKTLAFLTVAKILRQTGLSAPEIVAADPPLGLVLMEDFGTRNIGRLLDQGADAKPFYCRAVSVLAHLHNTLDALTLPSELPIFDAGLFIEQAGWFLDFYASSPTPAQRDQYNAALRKVLIPAMRLPQSLLLRDCTPDNLMDLPQREGVRGIGLLDFQDAGIGPVAYDLTSLCEVVRREGGSDLLDAMITHYCGLYHAVDPALMRQACYALSAQRHLRILGVLAKRALGGKTDKDIFIPRVRRHLQDLLQQDGLLPLREAVAPWL